MLFPRVRVKLSGRFSSYQVTQHFTHIFEPLIVAQIKGLLLTLFMYARCQHPQPVGHTKRSLCTFFFDVWQRWIHWQSYSCHLKLFEIWPFFTFDLLSVGQMKRLPWTVFDIWPRLTHWQCYFYHFTLFAIWPFLTFDPLTIGQVKRSPWTLSCLTPTNTLAVLVLPFKIVQNLTPFFDLSDLKWPQVKFIFIVLKDNVKLLHVYEWHDNHE